MKFCLSLAHQEDLETRRFKRRGLSIILLVFGILSPAKPVVAGPAAEPGYVIHFDFIKDLDEAKALVKIAERAGARVINVVPPAHVWERPDAVVILDGLITEISHRHLGLIFTRIDASFPPDHDGRRFYYLYSQILTAPGRLPDGRASSDYFRSTVGIEEYAAWMEEETRYYARKYSILPNLMGIDLGPFSEPFASERGGFLEFDPKTGFYEITQYTPEAKRVWHQWLSRHVGDLGAINNAYGAAFSSFEGVPQPRNECDERFGKPVEAYFDFVCSINDWFVDRYESCRRIWHQNSARDVPFILQFSGFEAEKFARGRSAYTAFDLPDWILRSDAVGLSVYTNSGYKDFGHGSVRSMVRLVSLAQQLAKPIFVLEGGAETPYPSLNLSELNFFASVAAPLQPRTCIYEFLKDPFGSKPVANSGRLVSKQGRIRLRACSTLQTLMKGVASRKEEPEPPVLYVIDEPLKARVSLKTGDLCMALYDLAARVSLCWIPPGASSIVPAGALVLTPDRPESLSAGGIGPLLKTIPPHQGRLREEWLQRLQVALSSATR